MSTFPNGVTESDSRRARQSKCTRTHYLEVVKHLALGIEITVPLLCIRIHVGLSETQSPHIVSITNSFFPLKMKSIHGLATYFNLGLNHSYCLPPRSVGLDSYRPSLTVRAFLISNSLSANVWPNIWLIACHVMKTPSRKRSNQEDDVLLNVKRSTFLSLRK